MRTSTTESYQERMNRVLTYIGARLNDPLPLDELAAVARLSPYHFHRIFRGMVGESVKEHVRRLRMERAAQRLRNSDDTVLDIALDAGYETHESFTRAFRAMFGEAPSEFRDSRRESQRNAHPTFVPGSMQVRIERPGPMRLAFVRHVGPFHLVGTAWQKLYSWAGRRGLLAGAPTALGVIHDDPEITPPERLRYDAALLVDSRVQPEGEIGIQEVLSCEYAATTHKGPYETLYLTYGRLCGEWLPASGREVGELPSLEFYRNSPMTVSPPELITDIYIPLEEE